MAHNDALADARRYEIMVILHPELGENATMQRLEALRKQITSFPGEVFHEELWGLRDLKYRIKKQHQGYYAVLDFVTDPSKIKEFNHALGLETEILRHMITILPPTYTPVNYEEEAAKEKALRDQEEALNPKPKKENRSYMPERRMPKPELVTKKVEEVDASRKPVKKNLEDVDAKLKKLIDDPDKMNF